MKGLLLICMPILFQMVFLACTIPTMLKTEHDLRTIFNAYRLARIASKLDRDICKFVNTDSPFTSAIPPAAVSLCNSQVDMCMDMMRHLNDSNRASEDLASMRSSVQPLLTSGNNKKVLQRPLSKEQIYANIKLASWLQELDEAIKNAMLKARAVSMANPLLMSQRRQKLQIVYGSAAAFYTLFVLLVLRFGINRTRNRISGIVQNSARLTRNEPILPPATAKDELGELESIFYERACWLQELRRLNEELVSVLSHELRTPLTGVSGMFTMLDENVFGQPKEEAAKLIVLGRRNCETIITVVNDLLDIEKIRAGQMTLVKSAVEPMLLVKEVSDSCVADAASKDVKLVLDETRLDKLDRLEIDSDRIKHAIEALLRFALGTTPRGSTVTITPSVDATCFHLLVTDECLIRSTADNDSVFDVSTGIPDQDIELRLSLSLAKLVAELHGGAVRLFEQEENNCVQLSLPLQGQSEDGDKPPRSSKRTTRAIVLLIAFCLSIFAVSGCTSSVPKDEEDSSLDDLFANVDGDIRKAQANFKSSATDLDLSESSTNDGTLKYLANLKQLKVLRLGSTQVTDVGVAYLAKLPNLESLDLSGCSNLTKDVCKSLSQCRHLVHLHFADTPVDDESLKSLSNLSNLQILYLKNSSIKGPGLAYLTSLKHLHELGLHYCHNLNPDSASYIRQLPTITVLHLSKTPIDDKSLQYVSQMKYVENLDLQSTNITGEGLLELTKLARLRYLNISYCKNLSPVDFKIIGALHSLVALDVFDDDVGSGLLEWRRLKLVRLRASQAMVSESGLSALNAMPLKLLCLANDMLTDQGVRQMRTLPLKFLRICTNPRITDASVDTLISMHSTLTNLDIDGTSITLPGQRRLKQAGIDINADHFERAMTNYAEQ